MTEGTSQTGTHSGPPLGAHPGHRKKFATPPVKIACLACRASRTRCDGGHPCASCKSKARECEYRPSKRGGARVRRKPKLDQETLAQMEDIPPEIPEPYQEPISIQNYIDPGAGLKRLGDWYQDSDFIFDSLFMTGVPDHLSGDSALSSLSTLDALAELLPPPPIPMVRTYKGDAAILDAYYIFIHPYFPILPPPTSTPLDNLYPRLQNETSGELDEELEPSSPVTLAISAILALIPCPNDPNYSSQESVLFRRKYAQFLAQSAIESIEIETEIPNSSIDPQRALAESPPDSLSQRPPFHPGVPRELESIIALDVLSVYEYAQRGNLKKMQSRAGQALVSATALSLHTYAGDDFFSEARRRVWWMTYVCVCQGSIVSNSQPTFAAFAPSFTSRYPTIQADPESFAVYIQAQQAILGATQFVIELNKAVQANGDMSRVYQRMRELELFLEPLITQSEGWVLNSTMTSTVDPSEAVVSRALRCMARIKLNSARIKVHRYCAFFDLPVFTGKHCDLKPKPALGDDIAQEPRRWPSCSCTLFSGDSSGGAMSASPQSGSGSTSPLSASMRSSPLTSDGGGLGGEGGGSIASTLTAFPFSSHASAKICLRSALNIAGDFDNLPYPNPTGAVCAAPPCYLSPTSTVVAPRTMPSFACCAMQCAYALLMVYQKTKAVYPAENGGVAPPGGLVGNLLVRLQQGLASIFGTLDNYAIASEALGGMRDQIRSAIEPTMGFVL